MRQKVLLVDDDQLFCTAVQRLLSVYHEVTTCTSKSAAIELLNQNTYDFFILDYHLKNESGTDLVPIIRERFPLAGIIFLSGTDDFSAVSKAMYMGADDYIIKSEDAVAHLLVRIPFVNNQKQLLKELHQIRDRPALSLPANVGEISAISYQNFLLTAETLYLGAAFDLLGGDITLTAEKVGLARSTIFKKENQLQFSKSGKFRISQ